MVSRFCAGLFALLPLACSADDLVFDDKVLSESFCEKLGVMADKKMSIDGTRAKAFLTAASGKKIPMPKQSSLCVLREPKSLYETCLPGVVAVGSVYKCGKCEHWHLGGFGTGWVLSSDGLIVTNYHVLEKDSSNTLGVMTSDGTVYAAKEVVAADKAGDAAILKVDTRGKILAALRLADTVTPGDDVKIISHPKGRFYCLSEGVVSRLHHQGAKEDPVWLSVTADYAVGSSGGPVLNEDGEVVGMVSRTVAATANSGKGDRQPGTQQMVFKDCVSLQTLKNMFQP